MFDEEAILEQLGLNEAGFPQQEATWESNMEARQFLERRARRNQKGRRKASEGRDECKNNQLP